MRLLRKHPILMLYLVAVVLRILLSLNGGQLFLRDEVRYWRVPFLAYSLIALNAAEGLEIFWATATPHFGFHLINAPVSLLYGLASFLLDVQMDFLAPAILTIALAPLSASHVLLVYALALSVGASQREALTAAFLTLCSTSLFYFSRHLVPYDASMAIILFGMWAGLQPDSDLNGRKLWRRSFVVGVVVGLGFLTYFGYWMIAAVALVLHVMWQRPSLPHMLQRALFSGLGLIAWPLLLTAITVALGEQPFVAGMRGFGGTITQGQFAEGWSLIWEFLWHTEGTLLLIVLAIIIIAVIRQPSKRLWLWLAISVMLYAIMALVSTGLEVFVIYGRLARQLTPFLMLAAAAGLSNMLPAHRPYNLALALIALTGFTNLMLPFMVQYPYQFAGRAQALSPEVQRVNTAGRLDWEYVLPDTINN